MAIVIIPVCVAESWIFSYLRKVKNKFLDFGNYYGRMVFFATTETTDFADFTEYPNAAMCHALRKCVAHQVAMQSVTDLRIA